MPRFGTTPLLLKIWSSGELWLPSKTNTERPHQKSAKHLQGKNFMVNTYLQCLQSLWMLFGIIVQKVFDTNRKFRYQRARNQKRTTIIISSSKIDKLKVALFFQICCYLVRKIEICLNTFSGKKIPNAAFVHQGCREKINNKHPLSLDGSNKSQFAFQKILNM